VKYDEELKRYLFTHKNKKQAGKIVLYLSKELTFQIHQVSLMNPNTGLRIRIQSRIRIHFKIALLI
jgi:hypothetical protein